MFLLPERTFIRDVLPEPLGPSIARHSPGFTYPLYSNRICFMFGSDRFDD